MNHSKNFWNLVAEKVPDYKAIRRQIKLYWINHKHTNTHKRRRYSALRKPDVWKKDKDLYLNCTD
jgi:hypothetical protein